MNTIPILKNICQRTLFNNGYQKNFYYTSSALYMSRMNFGQNVSPGVPKAVTKKVASKHERRDFMAVFPDIVRDLTEIGSHSDIPDTQKWYAKVIQYNTRDGKLNRGLSVVMAHKILVGKENVTPETLYKAHILGWCVELLQGHFLVADDIMDNSKTRRGKECWYRKDNLGLSAINDSYLLMAGIYKLIGKHFQNDKHHLDYLRLFHDVQLKTYLGQSLDLHSKSLDNRPLLDKFTMERYNAIVKYKTAYYSFYLPISLALYLSGIQDPELHRQAKTILLEMGTYFQVQDDYLDCYGNPEIMGKEGVDILEGKCTWLAVVALQRATQKQKQIMHEHYGVDDPESINNIVKLYNDLGISRTFLSYEEMTSNLIRKHIQQISQGINHKLFFRLLDAIERRSS